MADTLNVLGISCGVGAVAGAVIGGSVGFALCVWTSVKYIEPAFEDINGISPAGAKGITAGIDLLFGLEAFIGAGIAAGALTGAIVTPVAVGLAACTGSAISKAKDALSTLHRPSLNFFHRKNAPSTEANVPREPEVPRSPSARV